MKELRFETGLVSYDLNGRAEVQFNPTDLSFLEKVFAAFDALDEKQNQYEAERAQMNEPRQLFQFARKIDGEMRELIDAALGENVSGEVFGGMNVYAYAGGLPVWCNLLFAILDESDSTFTLEQQQTNPRMQKYLSKYKK